MKEIWFICSNLVLWFRSGFDLNMGSITLSVSLILVPLTFAFFISVSEKIGIFDVDNNRQGIAACIKRERVERTSLTDRPNSDIWIALSDRRAIALRTHVREQADT